MVLLALLGNVMTYTNASQAWEIQFHRLKWADSRTNGAPKTQETGLNLRQVSNTVPQSRL